MKNEKDEETKCKHYYISDNKTFASMQGGYREICIKCGKINTVIYKGTGKSVFTISFEEIFEKFHGKGI